MKPTLLSVVVPIFNMAGKFNNLLSWMPNTEGKRIQVILINDIHDEETSNELTRIIDTFENLDIEYIEGHFGNPGAARNAGLSVANGIWIAFWDCDDIPNVAEVLKMIGASTPSNEVLMAEFDVFGINSQVRKRVKFSADPLEDVGMNPGIWRMVFRKSEINNIRFPNLRMAEDQVFLARVGLPQKKICYYEESVYTYFAGGQTQLTSQKNSMSDLVPAAKEMLILLRKGIETETPFYAMLLMRQVIAGVRRGKMIVKIKLIFVAILAMTTTKKQIRSDILFASKKILRTRKERFSREK